MNIVIPQGTQTHFVANRTTSVSHWRFFLAARNWQLE